MLGRWDIATDLLHPRGAYVILGGLDRAGLRLAEELCRTVQARVVLIAGSAFPERGEWEGWIAERRPADPFARQIRRLLEIEKTGGKAVVLRANLTGEPQLEAVLDRAAARLGRLDGVFHLASPAPGIGRPALERILAGRDLDFLPVPLRAGRALPPARLGFLATPNKVGASGGKRKYDSQEDYL